MKVIGFPLASSVSSNIFLSFSISCHFPSARSLAAASAAAPKPAMKMDDDAAQPAPAPAQPIALDVTFTWSEDVDDNYQEVARETVRLDLADYMEEYQDYNSDPDAQFEMSDWIENLCSGRLDYGGDGDLDMNWVAPQGAYSKYM